MPARRLEDRIRELCTRALYDQGPDWTKTVGDLRLAIRELISRFENFAADAPFTNQPQTIRERRVVEAD